MKYVSHNLVQAKSIFIDIDWSTSKVVEIRDFKADRTVDQQAVVHILMRQIANAAGVDPELFKQKYIKQNEYGIFPYWPQRQAKNKEFFMMIPKSETKLTYDEASGEKTDAIALDISGLKGVTSFAL